MITVGLLPQQELVSLIEWTFNGVEMGYHVNQLCPRDKFWADHPDAPWNAYWNPDREYWVTEFPALSDVDASDVDAPWNASEPDRNPENYGDLYWVPPTVIPLIKNPQPPYNKITQICEPTIAGSWYEDRVERDWIVTDKPIPTLNRAPVFHVQPEDFYLKCGLEDESEFNKLLSLCQLNVQLNRLTIDTPIKIRDAVSDTQVVTVQRFLEIMADYGFFCYSLRNY